MGSKIVNIGIFRNRESETVSTLDLMNNAARICLDQPHYALKDIDLVINLSIYRTNDFVEPAMAAFVQRDLGINSHVENISDRKTLSLDLSNGSLGFLQGCQTVSAMIASKKIKTGLIVSGNSKCVVGTFVGPQQAFSEVGAATLLDEAPDENQGFSSFCFQSFPEYIQSYQSYAEFKDKHWFTVIEHDSSIEKIYLEVFSRGLRDYLKKSRIDLDSFDYIVPPQVSPPFVADVVKLLGVDTAKCVDVTDGSGNLLTASESVALHHLLKTGQADFGQKALVTNVGSGFQFGCATYVF